MTDNDIDPSRTGGRVMTFEEWWAEKDRVYANEYSTFKTVAAEAWDYQQARIEKLLTFVEEYQIPVGNSAAGEIACDMTYDALKEIRDKIRELL